MIFADLDECQEQKHNCHRMAHCNNTVGSFNCTCLQGFTGDGVSCFGMIYDRLHVLKYVSAEPGIPGYKDK